MVIIPFTAEFVRQNFILVIKLHEFLFNTKFGLEK
jgi:hypothetical protein